MGAARGEELGVGMLQVEDSRLQVRTLTARAGTNQGDANPPRSQTRQGKSRARLPGT